MSLQCICIKEYLHDKDKVQRNCIPDGNAVSNKCYGQRLGIINDARQGN